LQELKLKTIGIDREKFGRIFSFIDFGNVNYWYEKDRRDWERNDLLKDQKLIVDIEKLARFTNLFSQNRVKSDYSNLNNLDNSLNNSFSCSLKLNFL